MKNELPDLKKIVQVNIFLATYIFLESCHILLSKCKLRFCSRKLRFVSIALVEKKMKLIWRNNLCNIRASDLV